MPTLTVFTPTYNRAHTLPRTYKSLLAQSSRDFEWLIIDDGSSDGTKQLVEEWIDENRITIRYVFQDNQGMHAAHNTAYHIITTELNTCIDSDDYMPPDAVKTIVEFWKKNGTNNFAGIVGLDYSISGELIGTAFPDSLKDTRLRDYYECYGGKGDKKLVYRSEVIKSYPDYPIFEGEKYFGLAYKYYLVDKDYSLLTLNKPLVIVDYQKDGSSYGMWRQYWNNPRGFAFYRRFDMLQTNSLGRMIRDNVHYVSHSIRADNIHFLRESPKKVLTLLTIIPGFILYLINKKKVINNAHWGR